MLGGIEKGMTSKSFMVWFQTKVRKRRERSIDDILFCIVQERKQEALERLPSFLQRKVFPVTENKYFTIIINNF